MKKIVILVMFVLMASGYGCGGNTGAVVENPADPQNPEGSGSSNANTPTISSVKGDGVTADVFLNSLIIKGSNFTDTMDVELSSSTSTFTLSYSLDSSTQVTADLPTSLEEGDYQLSVLAGGGSALTNVTILRGTQGIAGAAGVAGVAGVTGPQGPAGSDGISIEAQFFCGMGSDIDNTVDFRSGQNAEIVRFSDGSYFMSCLVSYLNGTYLYVDTSSYSSWYAGNSIGVGSGSISCVPYYVTATYSITNNTITYKNQANASEYQTLTCSQVYP